MQRARGRASGLIGSILGAAALFVPPGAAPQTEIKKTAPAGPAAGQSEIKKGAAEPSSARSAPATPQQRPQASAELSEQPVIVTAAEISQIARATRFSLAFSAKPHY